MLIFVILIFFAIHSCIFNIEVLTIDVIVVDVFNWFRKRNILPIG